MDARPARRHVFPGWETLGREQLEARKWKLLRARLDELRATNPFYRALWDAHGVDLDAVRTPEDFLHRIPAVTKQELLDNQAEDPPFGTMLGVDRHELAEVHLTSGTSGFGQGVFGLTARDVDDAAHGYTHLWTYAGLEPGDIGILTYPVTFLTGGLLAVAASSRFGLVPFYAAGLKKQDMLKLLARFPVATIFGTPGMLRDLQVEAEGSGFDPRTDAKGLKALCTGLVMPPYEQIEHLRQFWGVPIHENYGLTEAANAVAVSCEQSVWDGRRKYPLHFLEHLFHVEVVDPATGALVEPGEPGELVLTTMRRQASPAIRYRTGDRVVLQSHASCPCGRPYDGIESGEIRRYDDMLKIKGMSVWPQSVERVLFSHPEVDEYRAIVEADDRGREHLTIQVAFSDRAPSGAQDRAGFLARLAAAVKSTANVTPRVVEVEALEHFTFKSKRWIDRRRGETAEAVGSS